MHPMETNYQKEGNKLLVTKNALFKGAGGFVVCQLLVIYIL